jgi:hypothetical protein
MGFQKELYSGVPNVTVWREFKVLNGAFGVNVFVTPATKATFRIIL